jgi:hypothetical protein
MPADVAMMEEVVRPLSSDGRLEAGMPSPSPGTNSSHGIAPGSGKKRGSAVVKEKNRRAAAEEEEDVEVVEELENGATVKVGSLDLSCHTSPVCYMHMSFIFI